MRFALLLLLGFLALSSCTDRDKEPLKDTETAVEKAYDTTTNALRDVVEGVNDAVYK